MQAIANLADVRLYEPALFRHLIEASALAGHDLARPSWAPLRNLFFLRFVASTIIGEAQGTWEELPADHHDVVWPAFAPKLQRAGHTIVRIDGAEHDITRELQAADPDMSDLETNAVIHVLEQSLLMLRDHFPDTGLCVVYIPSPAASYEIVSDTMNLAVGWTLGEYPTAAVIGRSDELRRLVKEMIAANDIDYLDATDSVRAASRKRILHGPLDWRHFNREGYQVLADVALRCPQLSIQQRSAQHK